MANRESAPYQNIVVLTGAGISRESGLHTFRDPDGIWATVNVDDVATPGAFARDPARVHAFYNARRRQLLGDAIKPNAAHLALSHLERRWSSRLTVVTQNIDDLHERAGTQNVIHMHGELLKARCAHCSAQSVCVSDLSAELSCASCGLSGGMRPDVVWFGEMPYHMDRIERELERADLFISIGTSGSVYPAAGFVQMARESNAYTVELNLEETIGSRSFHEGRYGPATEVVTAYLASL